MKSEINRHLTTYRTSLHPVLTTAGAYTPYRPYEYEPIRIDRGVLQDEGVPMIPTIEP